MSERAKTLLSLESTGEQELSIATFVSTQERLLICPTVKVAGNHVNEILDFCKQLNFSRLGCLCRRRFVVRFACLPIDIEHGEFLGAYC